MIKMKAELHCHTKMSQCRGLIEVEELLEYAAAHRLDAVAITDCFSVQLFPELYEASQKYDSVKVIYGMEGYLEGGYPVLIYVKNEEGLRNLYQLMSASMEMARVAEFPMISKTLLQSSREGLLLGSVCDGGEVSTAFKNVMPDDGLQEILSFYDFLEITPYCDDVNHRIYALGTEAGKPVIMTSDCYYLNREDKKCFDILRRYYDDTYNSQTLRPAHMKDEREYVQTINGICERVSKPSDVEEYLMKSQMMIMKQIENVTPKMQDRYLPVYPEADRLLEEISKKRACELYGEKLPEEVNSRLDLELSAIRDNGYSSLYMIWYDLVKKSREDGYPVRSRGEENASFVAYLLGIAEFNPLRAHYRCGKCHYTNFDTMEMFLSAPQYQVAPVGPDLEDKICPVCGQGLIKDGFDLSLETFMGRDLDHEPDMDILFASAEQGRLINYLTTLPGIGGICRAKIAERMQTRLAKALIIDDYEKRQETLPEQEEIKRMTLTIRGVKTGKSWHDFRWIIVPDNVDILSFTPAARLTNSAEITTHLSYWWLRRNFFTISNPTEYDMGLFNMIRRLTGIDLKDIPLDDQEVIDTLYKHPTEKIIGTCDDVLQYLLRQGVEHDIACHIMEAVSINHTLPKIWHSAMQERLIPDDFITFCEKVRELPSRAEVVSRVIWEYRKIWYLTHYPKEYKRVFD